MSKPQPSEQADFLVVGGGIAGASVAWHLAPSGRVIVLERESLPGYHSTGRSAAVFAESHGGAQVRALTKASRGFLESPPPGFAEHPLLKPHGALLVATHGQEALLQRIWQSLRTLSDRMQILDAQQACAIVPVLRPERVVGAVYDPAAADVDVNALHQGFLRAGMTTLSIRRPTHTWASLLTAFPRRGDRSGIWQAAHLPAPNVVVQVSWSHRLRSRRGHTTARRCSAATDALANRR